MAGNGIDLVRTWGFLNGAQDPYAVGVALQPSVRWRLPCLPGTVGQAWVCKHSMLDCVD